MRDSQGNLIKYVYSYKPLRNVRIREIVRHCNSCDDCDECPFETFCRSFSLFEMSLKLNKRIRLQRKYVWHKK